MGDLERDLEGSERSCAVLAGAILDDQLLRLIEKYLIEPDRDGQDKLLGQSSPIGSFSSRIELSRRLNLISKETRQAMDWVREIRNHASHSTEFSFSEDRIYDRISNLTSILKINDTSPVIRPGFVNHRGRFVAAVIMLGICLEVETSSTGRTIHVPKYPTLNINFSDSEKNV